MAKIHVGVLGLLGAGALVAFFVAPMSGRFERDALMILCAVLAIIWHLAATGPLLGVAATVADVPAHVDPTASDDEAAADDGLEAVDQLAPEPAHARVSLTSEPTQPPIRGLPTEPSQEPEPTEPAEPAEPTEILHRPGYFDLPGAAPASIEVELPEPSPVEDASPPSSGSRAGSGEPTAEDAEVDPGPPSVAQLWPPEGVEIPLEFIEVGETSAPTRPDPMEEIIDLRTDTVAEEPQERSGHEPEEWTEAFEVVDSDRTGDPWLAFAAAMFRDAAD